MYRNFVWISCLSVFAVCAGACSDLPHSDISEDILQLNEFEVVNYTQDTNGLKNWLAFRPATGGTWCLVSGLYEADTGPREARIFMLWIDDATMKTGAASKKLNTFNPQLIQDKSFFCSSWDAATFESIMVSYDPSISDSTAELKYIPQGHNTGAALPLGFIDLSDPVHIIH